MLDLDFTSSEGVFAPYRIKLRNGKNVLAKTEKAVRKAGVFSGVIESLTPKDVAEDELNATFESIDVDGSGAIDADELSDALDSFGYALDAGRVKDLLFQCALVGRLQPYCLYAAG